MFFSNNNDLIFNNLKNFTSQNSQQTLYNLTFAHSFGRYFIRRFIMCSRNINIGKISKNFNVIIQWIVGLLKTLGLKCHQQNVGGCFLLLFCLVPRKSISFIFEGRISTTILDTSKRQNITVEVKIWPSSVQAQLNLVGLISSLFSVDPATHPLGHPPSGPPSHYIQMVLKYLYTTKWI